MHHDTDVAFDEARLLGPDARRSPEMEAVWSWLLEQDAEQPNWLALPADQARSLADGLSRRWNTVLPPIAGSEDVTVSAWPPVQCQMITPIGAEDGCILFLHGGGWAFGNLQTHQRLMRLLATASRRRVLGVDYRLAPEQPYPAPLDDVRAAWRWLARSGPTGPLAIAGDSAGANLAMGTMLAAIRDGETLPDAALLFYGAYEAGTQSASARRFADGFGLTRAGMTRFWSFYAPDPATHGDPLVSALFAPDAWLRELPPLYLNAAGLDPLLSDTLGLVKRLRLAGARHEFVLHDGVHHGFMQMSLHLDEAQRAVDLAALFLTSQFAAR